MSVETASWVTQLNTANPVVGDPVGEGDDHLRMIKTVLQNSFSLYVYFCYCSQYVRTIR